MESNLALHRRMRFCTADSVDVSFCPVMRCLSIMTCIPSGSVAEKKRQTNNLFVIMHPPVGFASISKNNVK